MKLYDIIREWVGHTYGTQEMEDPCWNIKALAEHISKSDIDPDELSAYTKCNVYGKLDQHYVEEDVEQFANDRGIKLTDKQIGTVASEIRDSEWYCSINSDDMEWYINQELRKGE